MSSKKDELISASELARRINVDPSFISRQRVKLRDAKCMFGKKFYYQKSCDLLGKDHQDPHKSRQSSLQTDVIASKKEENRTITTGKENIEKKIKEITGQKKEEPEDQSDNPEEDAKSLLDQILKAINSGSSSENRQKLDLLRQKAGVLREYFTAKNEEIKNRKLEDNLFEKDEVMKILSFSVNAVRNSLINLSNNYAVNLEGMSKKQIKEFVADDINRILEDFQNIGSQFEN